MNSIVSTITTLDPTSFSGIIQLLLGALGIMLVLATIFLPFIIWDIRACLRRMEKLHRQVSADIVNELRRLR